ncbi:MAG: hypothetical protein WAU59_18480 [Rhodoplanes sp.]
MFAEAAARLLVALAGFTSRPVGPVGLARRVPTAVVAGAVPRSAPITIGGSRRRISGGRLRFPGTGLRGRLGCCSPALPLVPLGAAAALVVPRGTPDLNELRLVDGRRS